MNDSYLNRALEKIPNKQILVTVAAKRARQLAKGERPMIRANESNLLDLVLLEIAEGKIVARMPGEPEDLPATL